MSNEVRTFLSSYNPEVRKLASQARELIFSLVPNAQEKVRPGWKVIHFSLGGKMKDIFCGIGPQKTYIGIFLPRAVDLDDPKSLLEGTGKKMRHVKIKTAEEMKNPALKSLIAAAAALTRSEQQK